MKVKHSLLEDLAKILRIPYLSDLHNIPTLDLVNIIQTMDLEYYSLEEWNYGLSYILRAKVKLASLNDVIQTLVSLKK